MEKKQSRNLSRSQFSWVGYPDDLGVKNVNGRPGAKEGPQRFLDFFLKLKGKWPHLEFMKEKVMLQMGETLEDNFQKASLQTQSSYAALNLKNDALVVVGGGHDYAYPWIKAIREVHGKKARIACLNLDAHFDLRDPFPVMSSGAPFRRLIEEKILEPKRLVEFGIQAHCNGPELWDYAKKHKIKLIPFEKLRNGRAVSLFRSELKKLSKQSDVVLLSLDLDAISFAFAPGVSAPQAEGFTASEIFQMLEIAGSDKKVTSLGVFELSPALDLQDQASRLSAQAVWHFLSTKL